MKLTLKLIWSIFIVMTVIAVGYSFFQTRHEMHQGYDGRVAQIWVDSFWRVLIQILFVSLTTLVVVYWHVLRPVRRTTDWIRNVRMGLKTQEPDTQKNDFLSGLSREVLRMVKSLELARLTAEEEAKLRLSNEATWTPERLKEYIRIKLHGRSLFVVSYREPYVHSKKGKKIEYIVPASGLVTAIEPILKACGGTWISQAGGDADRETSDADGKLRVPPDDPQYTLKRIWVTKEEETGHYNGFSNEGLWPLCHVAHTRPVFRTEDWKQYQAVNQRFADAVLAEIEGCDDPCVLIQDYHFALLPLLIKKARPDARVALFWHIPWPNPESFGICPWQKEILQGLLGSDLIGFHTQFHCNNFIETVDRFLESRIDREHFAVNREGQTTWVKPFPISIAFSGRTIPVDDMGIVEAKNDLLKPYGLQADYLGVGVDRLDYTKGMIERFRSVELFLEKYPQYQGRFTFVELGAPSRTLIPKYQEFIAEVEQEVSRINGRFKAKNWKPILLIKKHHSHEEIAPFYKTADLCMVTSLHDGMNLVAKEFVTSREDEKGVLILSQFTGAARELDEAILINPYNIGQTADAIRQALEMSVEEQSDRMRQMRLIIKERNIFRWAADLVGELAQIKKGKNHEVSMETVG